MSLNRVRSRDTSPVDPASARPARKGRRGTPPGRRLLAGLVAAGAVCAGLSAVPASAATEPPVVSRGVTIPAFYTPPAELPRSTAR